MSYNIHNGNVNIAVSHYLMASYLYYIENISMLKDYEYDELCKFIYENYDDITHRHKYLVEKESLTAGTGFTIKKEDYPKIVIGAAYQYMNERGKW